MRFALTGGSGGIGRLVKSDLHVDFRSFHSNPNSLDWNKIADLSTLVHLAAVTDVSKVESNPEESHLINVTSTVELFREFSRVGGKRFVFASTGHVYGVTQEGKLSSETDVLNPKTLYAEQKALTEQALFKESLNTGVQLVVLRIFSIFGEGLRNHFLAGKVEEALKDRRKVHRISNSDDVRDFSTPERIASLIEKCTCMVTPRPITMNLCTGIATSVREIVSMNFQIPDNNWFLPGNSDSPRLVGDPTYQNKVLGLK